MPGINTLLLSTGALGVFYMLGDDSPDIHGTNGFTWYPSHGRQHSPMLKARFLHLTILVAAGIEPPTS